MHVGRRIAAMAAATAVTGGLVGAGATAAFADYGPSAVHQVEISANLPPNVFGPGTGGGIWLWIELDSTSTGTYQGADCLHHAPAINPSSPTSAVHDSGDVAWSSNGSTITITGVVIGGTVPVTIVVPESGHETTSVGVVFPGLVPPGVGTAQVEVAP